MRIYIPATSTLLERLVLDGEMAVTHAFAVTPLVRDWYEGDDEELEYIATSVAARASLTLLHSDSQALSRRVVLAAELENPVPVANGHRAEVAIGAVVKVSSVVAALVDDGEAEKDVAAARGAIGDGATSEDARFAVEQAQSHELLWFAAQELPFIF